MFDKVTVQNPEKGPIIEERNIHNKMNGLWVIASLLQQKILINLYHIPPPTCEQCFAPFLPPKIRNHHIKVYIALYSAIFG